MTATEHYSRHEPRGPRLLRRRRDTKGHVRWFRRDTTTDKWLPFVTDAAIRRLEDERADGTLVPVAAMVLGA